MKTAIAIVWFIAIIPLAVIEAMILLTVVAVMAVNTAAGEKVIDVVGCAEKFLFIGQVDKIFKFTGAI